MAEFEEPEARVGRGIGSRHYLIVVPGIPAWTPICKLLVYPWQFLGFLIHVEDLHFASAPADFGPRLARLTDLIDVYSNLGRVSLIGISAGGVAVLNAFFQRMQVVHTVILICARLRRHDVPSVDAARLCHAVALAIDFFQTVEPCIPKEYRHKILTISGLFDEKFGDDSISVDGAPHVRLPMIFHAFIILSALTIFARPLIAALRSGEHNGSTQ